MKRRLFPSKPMQFIMHQLSYNGRLTKWGC